MDPLDKLTHRAFAPLRQQLEETRGPRALLPAMKMPGGKHCLDDETISEPSSVSKRDPKLLRKRKRYHPVIFIDGQDVDIEDFLRSEKYRNHVLALTDTKMTGEGVERNALNTEPTSWQAIGQQKLWLMAHSIFRGGLLGDPVGLGKSLTTLLFAVRFKKEYPDSGPILVVARKSCILQWKDEIITHFKAEHRPTFIILNDINHSVQDILSYDIVICSVPFVRRTYRAYANFEATWTTLLYNGDMSIKRHRRIDMPLHSALYDRSGDNISVLIIDEIHDGRNHDSLYAAALRSLKPRVTIGLSGTIVHNKWTDVFSQLSLIPGCPFQDIDHFRTVFGTSKETKKKEKKPQPMPPDEERMRLLKRFMVGIVVARPKSIMKLPPIHSHVLDIGMEDDLELQQKIASYTRMAVALFSKSFKHKKGSSALARQGFQCVRAAQAHAASPLLVREKDDAGAEQNEDHDKDQEEEKEEEEVKQAKEKKKAPEKTKAKEASKRKNKGKERKGSTAHAAELDRKLGEIAKRLMDRAEQKGIYEEEFRYHHEDLDEDYSPMAPFEEDFSYLYDSADDLDNSDDLTDDGLGDSEDEYTSSSDDDEEQDDPNPFPRSIRRSSRAEARIWVRKLEDEPDSAIFSYRVECVVKACQSILRDFQDEKIIIASEKIMFLDIIKEGIRRRATKDECLAVGVAEFNGTIKSCEERAEILSRFNKRGEGPRILLISADAGGTGLNITGASHLILTEPFWSDGKRQQMIGRVYRMPQPLPVHVYDCLSIFSEIDALLTTASVRKAEVGHDLMSVLRRADDAPLDIDL